MTDANSAVVGAGIHDEHVKFFSKFIYRRLKKTQQPQILTIDQAKQVDKDSRYVDLFMKRLINCDVLARIGWLGDIEAFRLTDEAYKDDLTLDEIKSMLMTSGLESLDATP